MNNNLFLLPETIDVFGMTFLVNGVTLSIAAIPILWIFFIGMYVYRMRKQAQASAKKTPPLLLSDSMGTFYQYERSFAPGFEVYPENRQDSFGYQQPSSAPSYPNYFNDSAPVYDTQAYNGTVIDLDIEDVQLVPDSADDGFFVDEVTRPVEIPAFILKPVANLVATTEDANLPSKLSIGGDEPIRFGRRKSLCDHVIPDMRISRLHAVIVPQDDNLYIRDEGSSGGTFVNQRRLGPTDQLLLRENDIISFNDISFRLEFVN